MALAGLFFNPAYRKEIGWRRLGVRKLKIAWPSASWEIAKSPGSMTSIPMRMSISPNPNLGHDPMSFLHDHRDGRSTPLNCSVQVFVLRTQLFEQMIDRTPGERDPNGDDGGLHPWFAVA